MDGVSDAIEETSSQTTTRRSFPAAEFSDMDESLSFLSQLCGARPFHSAAIRSSTPSRFRRVRFATGDSSS